VRKCLSVIARRSGHEGRRVVSVLLDEGQHGVERTANLEREGRLKRFELEKNLAAGSVR
jgi:hypothetical protein